LKGDGKVIKRSLEAIAPRFIGSLDETPEIPAGSVLIGIDGDMTIRREVITPEIAKRYLGRNTENRDPRRGKILLLARAMVGKHWRRTHQGIAFDRNGRLVDGQHRLKAIEESGIPVEMYVFRGLDVDAYMGIDQGTARNPVDIAKSYGVNMDAKRRATNNAISNSVSSYQAITAQEELDLFMEREEAIEFAHSAIPHGHHAVASIRAVIARAWYGRENRPKLRALCETMMTYYVIRDEDETIVNFCKWHMANKDRVGTGAAKGDLYRRFEKAVAAYFEGRVLKRIDPVDAEQFPIPEHGDY
jgi:hypothetical protein